MVTETTKKLPLTSDIVFKRVFSREDSKDILKDLLEAILEIQIQNVEVKNPELPRNLYDGKAGILDVKAEINNHTLCDIELQVRDLKNMKKRSTYYYEKKKHLLYGKTYIREFKKRRKLR